jgi:hypothetical protein
VRVAQREGVSLFYAAVIADYGSRFQRCVPIFSKVSPLLLAAVLFFQLSGL